MYPDYWDSTRRFIKTYRPLIEIKIKPWGWDGYNWTDPQLPSRIDLGFSDYKILIETDYSDSGRAQILAPPELYRKYQETYGQD